MFPLNILNKTNSNGLSWKTPVSILQELLIVRGITPDYKLIQIEGTRHEPTFRYQVSFKEEETPFSALGTGRSKKEAKQAAARALIETLESMPIKETVDAVDVNTSLAVDSGKDSGGSNVGDEEIVINLICWLQEVCIQRRWPPPSYETVTEVGLPHEPLFTVACTILHYRELGRGRTKKLSKRLAAHNMWKRLKEEPIDSIKCSNGICRALEGVVIEQPCLKILKLPAWLETLKLPAAKPYKLQLTAAWLDTVMLPAAKPKKVKLPASVPEIVKLPAAQLVREKLLAAEPERENLPADEPEREKLPASVLGPVKLPSAKQDREKLPAAEPEREKLPAAEPEREKLPAPVPETVKLPAAKPEKKKPAAKPETKKPEIIPSSRYYERVSPDIIIYDL